MSSDRRYQVFVSSTYEDLREERQEVMQALLELDCIPAGMELFPATDDDQWTLIKRVIDECDYYIVIIGGRYGSIGPKGISYTEQEYRYALDTGKPVIAFLHKDLALIPVGKSEADPESVAKLMEFRELTRKKVCKFWERPSDLGSAVSRSLVRLINTHPMPGWIRADKAAAAVAATEVLRLRKTIEDLQAKLAETQLSAPKGSEDLAQGVEPFPIDYSFEAYAADREVWSFNRQLDFTWNEIFEEIGPLMLDEAADDRIRAGLAQLVRTRTLDGWDEDPELTEFGSPRSFAVSARDEQTIKIQLRALGLIEQSKKARSIKDTRTFWSLTAYGDAVLVQLRAIRKGEFKPVDEGSADEAPEAEA
ncbi:DUF4062 domain-containing protein [Rubrivivax albus]|uniref:DUF4062 domain-containing protein n=1 Tax=Rubrivivax albus TaxID=2499835 RepID=A0A437JL57_9BURK|nr:DUF4062 domain-containing protein [Rubrivivax albus]RVT47432.1 DUF4062 domain-containing protein [Rubrivivax albus]